MEVTINNISDVQREAQFVLTDAELQPHFDRAYKKFAPKVEVKGFRKGKVPLSLIKKMYGEAIEHDALDDIANDSFRDAMVERNIEPLGRPSLVDMDFKRGEAFRFTIKYEVKPTIELKKYKGLKVEKLMHKVTDAEVDSEIERLRKINSSLLGVTLVKDDGDYQITADVQELDDAGTPLIGKRTKDAKFYIQDETLAPEIRETLKAAEVGGEYRTRFESQHGDHSHKHHIAISVKKIEKVELPDFDDELVKKVTQGKTETKDEFVAQLRKDLEGYWNDMAERSVENALVDEIVTSHEVEVPESLVNLYLDAYMEDLKRRSGNQPLPKNFDEQAFRERNRNDATQQAKWALIREQIIEKEQLVATDEDLDKLAGSEAQMYGMEKAKLLEYYKNSGGASDRIVSKKLMTLLKENAKITEKTVEETA